MARITSRTPAGSTSATRFLGDIDGIVGAPLATDSRFVDLLEATPDPHQAALGLLRVLEQCEDDGRALVEAVGAGGPDPVAEADLDRPLLARLLRVLGTSEAMVDHLVRHPDSLGILLNRAPYLMISTPQASASALRETLLESVGADPDDPAPVAAHTGNEGIARLRRAYRDVLLALMADDLFTDQPEDIVDLVTAVLSDLASAAMEAGLSIARAELDPEADVRMAVIALGKTGARELNYVSDVDVVFVLASESTDAQRRLATEVAQRMRSILSDPGAEPALWEVDTALRPEGKAGALVRTMSEFEHYYADVAKNWEFQALLKARPVAGDSEVGTAFTDTLGPLVWEAAGREGFIDGIRAMRRRVVDLIPAAEAPRQIKLGRGGLRDVEFSAQLLQLVHGQSDDEIRSPNTLLALSALGEHGYIGQDDAAAFSAAYRFMRVVEHRVQIPRMLRNALIPDDEAKLRTLARSVFTSGTRSGERLEETRRDFAKQVTRLHEQIFYRPVLDAAVGVHGAVVDAHHRGTSLQAAADRLRAFGYRDPQGALGHIKSLTAGMSRTAHVIRQVLPALLDWFSDGVDPDAALLSFRRLTDSLSSSSWFLKMLRDSGLAAKSVAEVLTLSGYATELLLRQPAAVAWLDDYQSLHARDLEVLGAEIEGLLSRHGGAAVSRIRETYSRELLRIALRDVLDVGDRAEVPGDLSDLMDLTVSGALAAVRLDLDEESTPDYEFAVIAMGRWGGREIGYFSDGDAMFVYRARDEDLDAEARAKLSKHVNKVALQLTSRLKASEGAKGIDLDADLRPEGKNGPLVRTFASYQSYYAKWSEPWEAQALLRARPVAGDSALTEEFTALIDPLRYPEQMTGKALTQVRTLKARMEDERLPKGADKRRHLKLGRGSLSDVEWTVQLLQLRFAHSVPGLRTTSTLPALEAAAAADLIPAEDAAELAAAWQLATNVRSAVMLFRGRTAESLPDEHSELEATARLLGYPAGGGRELEDDYLRATRHARSVMENRFYEF
ncbi:bifunctional [glutamine synthetase] adenylyltransferase/[glutamine synthetase]-adenylyl-L-tyrosine phosphorylase [Brevibacterium casei]|uniref:bifunctional [glutamine synthetase] adenylyltransferase/[glutamine synthetase]-adenylyl-L-tyrosine phosphorylase n=1 Tax=Brevibacterium casei TaxID=33889 RepID=UPI0021B08038|nr:bifunctional [glutamine synthetase] adenylyltransferase/[glutamine synthetase]-adenylyl-L-tyrosine phosphorylase [Brevibacterium casei]MCT2358081.1 bifunctional [glutamine synthetase] adenylyltransferase/[glutamine synthetase]-adenylyl-L-tyrosine phosphorylase [Brevibacterium casei]